MEPWAIIRTIPVTDVTAPPAAAGAHGIMAAWAESHSTKVLKAIAEGVRRGKTKDITTKTLVVVAAPERRGIRAIITSIPVRVVTVSHVTLQVKNVGMPEVVPEDSSIILA